LYQAALDELPAEMRQPFVEACVAAGIAEDDVVHGLALCQATLLGAFVKLVDASNQKAINAQAQQLATTERNVIQRLDLAHKDEQTARERHQKASDAKLEEIRRRETKLAVAESQGWQQKVINNGLLILCAAFLGGLILYSFDSKRLDAANAQAHEREKAFLASLPYATRLEVALEHWGGRMESQPGRLVIHPGKNVIKNAYRDPVTGDAVIVHQ
jgi:hypothetical protein